ncbi:MAG: nucleotidyltransferase [Bacteroidota bacterium]
MKPTLLILAAGMGSRYGGLKQIDGVGPSGEAIIEYSIFDAIRAGFGKVVFVIRGEIEDAFREFIQGKFQDKIEIAFAFQELEMVPEGVSYTADRIKPWGTGHAVLVAKEVIDTPFAMINADDFYGREAFGQMADYLKSMPAMEQPPYCIVGYRLANTLSDHGSVSRGDCVTDEEGFLLTVTERTQIERKGERVVYTDDQGNETDISENTIVSMNMIGFAPNVFEHLDHYFAAFIRERGQELKSEYYVPTLLTQLINADKEKVKVIPTNANWFGVTYKEDRPKVVADIQALVDAGEYPSNLWA